VLALLGLQFDTSWSLLSKDDSRAYRGAGVKRIMVTAISWIPDHVLSESATTLVSFCSCLESGNDFVYNLLTRFYLRSFLKPFVQV
jgi:hypothetical protein